MAIKRNVVHLKDQSGAIVYPKTTVNQISMDYSNSTNLKSKIDEIQNSISTSVETAKNYTDAAVSAKSNVIVRRW